MPQAAAQLPLPSHILFGLLLHLEKFLLELGRGFAFVGRQYRIEVSDREFYLDLLRHEHDVATIDHQEEHHRTKTFQDEYRAFLTKYGIEFDERYVWG